MFTLTDWDTGERVAIDPRAIVELVELPPVVDRRGGQYFEYGRRTRVDTNNQSCCVVRERPGDIRRLMRSCFSDGA